MKNHKFNDRNSFAIVLFLVLLSNPAFTQTRNTVWLDGFRNTTSHGWGGVPNNFYDLRGYDFVDLIANNADSTAEYDLSLGIFGAATQVEPQLDGHDNVLGIAHDMGGLVLRDLANKDNTLSAMILNGVPNNGSAAINFATKSDGSGITLAQNLVEGVQAIQAGDDCSNCGLVATFQAWIDEIDNSKAVLGQMARNSSEINTLNQNPPDIPFAVLWGSMEVFSITSLMSSKHFAFSGVGVAFEDQFTKCYTERLSRDREDAKKAFFHSTIDNTVGFFGNVLNFVGGLLGDGVTPGDIIGSVGEFVNNAKDNIISQIEAERERDQELARILRCELANQYLATQWQLSLIAFGSFTTEEVTIGPDMSFCEQYCWDNLDPSPYTSPTHAQFGACVMDCMDNPGTPILTETVYVAEENDGLLTEGEQLLAGADYVYHLYDHNHFQETKLSSHSGSGTLNDALQELFDGTAGMAFEIPQQ